MGKKALLSAGLLLWSCVVHAQNPLVITVVTSGSFTEAGKSIVSEAYRRIGVPIAFKQLPGERALISTNEGKTDGELFRIDNMNQRYPNLIQIPVSYIPDEVSAFSKLDIDVDGWESLKGYTTAVRRGDKFIEDMTKDMQRFFVSNDLNSFQMLEADRVEVVIASRWDGLEYTNQIDSETIRALSPSIVTNPLFHYLNNKHSDLAPKLAAAFQEMHEDGTIQQILSDAEAAIFE